MASSMPARFAPLSSRPTWSGSTPGRCRWPTCAASWSCSTSGPTAESTASTSSRSCGSSSTSFPTNWSSSGSTPPSSRPKGSPRTCAPPCSGWRCITRSSMIDEHQVWEEYAVRAWPTLMLVDPRGRVFAKHEGEFPLEPMRVALADLIAQYDAEGILDRRPLTLDPLPPGGGTLRFPGKVLADAASNRLFIADSGHNRILVADLDGRVTMAIGDGEPGFVDGSAGASPVRPPAGTGARRRSASALRRRRAEPRHPGDRSGSGQVTTVAGTGEQGYDRLSGGPGERSRSRRRGTWRWSVSGSGSPWPAPTSSGRSIWRPAASAWRPEPAPSRSTTARCRRRPSPSRAG